jgi:hypothetical protein
MGPLGVVRVRALRGRGDSVVDYLRKGETMERITHDRKVVTWQTPRGDVIDICPSCEATLMRRKGYAGAWPTNEVGEQYCQVSHGAHEGACEASERDVREIRERAAR